MVRLAGKDHHVVLDACVLAPMPLCDTLLRCAEEPALYHVVWSAQTLDEVARTLRKFGYSEMQAGRRIAKMREAFPETTFSAPAKMAAELREMPDPNLGTIRELRRFFAPSIGPGHLFVQPP